MTDALPLYFHSPQTDFTVHRILSTTNHPTHITLTRPGDDDRVVQVLYWAVTLVKRFDKPRDDGPDPTPAWVGWMILPLVFDPARCEVRPLHLVYGLAPTPPTSSSGGA